MIIQGFKIVVGWNNERSLRYGIHREKIGPKGSFTALGVWPLLIGISARKPNGMRWTR